MGYSTETLKTGQTLRAKRMEERDEQQSEAEAPREKVVDMGTHTLMAGPLPTPPKGVRRKKGPSDDELVHLPRDRYIRINKGEVKLSSLKSRLSQLKKKTREAGREVHLICWEQSDGTIIVRHA